MEFSMLATLVLSMEENIWNLTWNKIQEHLGGLDEGEELG